MDDKKKPENGTFTQIPNVFFDTCDLPESAQILYLRLYRHVAYKDDHKFVGSIRKLSTFVRLSKSTVERMTKVLEEARLIHIGYESSQEQDRKIMTITINPQELWLLNKQHHEDKDVPNWDKVIPVVKVLSQFGTVCPDMGQNTINLGQHDVNLGQTVPDVSSKSAQESISTTNTTNTSERKNAASEQTSTISNQQSSFSHSFTQSSSSEISFSAEEETVYQLAIQKHISALKRNQDHKAYCAKLASKGVTTPEKIESLMQHCWRKLKHKGNVDLYLKNLVTELEGWLQVQEMPQVPPSPSRNPQPIYVIDQEANERRKAALRARAIS